MAITIIEIAKIAGVSIATVSRVVNGKSKGVSEETRARIKDIIEKYDYHTNTLAKSLVTKKTKSIGLILPDVSNPFFSDIAKSVEAAAAEAGYNVFLCNSDENFEKEKNYIRALTDKNVDGVIFIPASNKKRTTGSSVFEMPVVLIDRDLPGDNVGVFLDNQNGGYIVTTYLIESGHTKIAFIGGPVNDHNANDRFEGYKIACRDNNIEVYDDYIMFGEYTIQSGISFSKRINELDVTACVCANDLIAMGLISGLKKLGKRVPENISVTGFDDIFLSDINDPPITTVKQPTYEMGKKAVQILMHIINHDKKAVTSRTLQSHLVIRNSSKKL